MIIHCYIEDVWEVLRFIEVGKDFGEFWKFSMALWIGVLLIKDDLNELVVDKCLLRLY